MKSTLEFNLPEEEPEMRDALNGTLWRGVVTALYEKMKRIDKVGQSGITIENLRELLNEECNARGLDPFSP